MIRLRSRLTRDGTRAKINMRDHRHIEGSQKRIRWRGQNTKGPYEVEAWVEELRWRTGRQMNSSPGVSYWSFRFCIRTASYMKAAQGIDVIDGEGR